MHYYRTIEDFTEWTPNELLTHIGLSNDEAHNINIQLAAILKQPGTLIMFPPELKKLLLIYGGYLEAISNEFAGWRLLKDKLITPNGYEYLPGEILAIPYYQQILREARIAGNQRANKWRYPVQQPKNHRS